MISETLAPFVTAGMVVLLWALVAFLWVLAHELVKDHTWFGNKLMRPDLEDYAIAGLVMIVLCALTYIVFLWTLSIIGVV